MKPPPASADVPANAPVHAFEREVLIRFSHCDPAGIVFYPQYFVLFNGLVEDWVGEAMGVPYAEVIGRQRIGLPTVSLQCDFTAVSRMGDVVSLGLSVLHVGSRSIQLAIGCRCGGEARVHGRQVLVSTSLDTHRAVALPPALRAAATAMLPS